MIIESESLPLPDPLKRTHFCRIRLVSGLGCSPRVDHACSMFTEIYVEALLADEDLADQVFELWNAGAIADEVAAIARFVIQAGPMH